MAVSKRTRFEVLRRDAHTCRYCGAKAPDVTLHVDHVAPKSLGGTDDPSNLVTACKDCNLGKSSTAPDQAMVADVDESAAMWVVARTRAAEKRGAANHARKAMQDVFLNDWMTWDASTTWLPVSWRTSINQWLDAGLSIEEVIEASDIAVDNKRVTSDQVFRYMAGICKNKIEDLNKLTMAEFSRMREVN